MVCFSRCGKVRDSVEVLTHKRLSSVKPHLSRISPFLVVSVGHESTLLVRIFYRKHGVVCVRGVFYAF